ncbi:heterocyst development glycosyltransferase HepC [Leptolyngbya sp. FACHB-711]|uniref:heterocyst development glycosyltransferase HepC n=1 Tax=unclassified Leptolyngbya TaxID=2650499 RepID=UPI00168294F1|nr:heterocyst development glycosyltransferase HepC [Leptolyngbya sp. FACHB-711]MBD2028372.1 sugar transferase [Leptolyngbya sp. FACHB-711]
MTATRIRLTNIKVLRLENSSWVELDIPTFSNVTLCWRSNFLFVNAANASDAGIPALRSEQWLKDCLRLSSVAAVCLNIKLSETALQSWADACHDANRPVFLTVLPSAEFRNQCSSLGWRTKRFIDWFLSALMLLVLSPLMAFLMVLVKLSSPGPIFFRQWRVGGRGRLFKIWKFRTMVVNAEETHHTIMGSQQGLHKHKDDPRVTPIGRFMRKYSLDELPQLINVLRGEMSLVGPQPWTIYDAIRIKHEDLHRLRALPGITGLWQVLGRSHLVDLDTVSQLDLEYLKSWSLWKDFQILLMTIPKVLTGFGAY